MQNADIDRLLDFIVTTYAVTDDQMDIELLATASDGGDSISADQAKVATAERERAKQLTPSFRSGLQAAIQARNSGQTELQLDDRIPEQNAIADALIAYLVRYRLAESRSTETSQYHYTYYISVDWPQLERVAKAAGADLGWPAQSPV